MGTRGLDDEKSAHTPFDTRTPPHGARSREETPAGTRECPRGRWKMHYDYSFPSQKASSLARARVGAQARLNRDIAASTPWAAQVNAA